MINFSHNSSVFQQYLFEFTKDGNLESLQVIFYQQGSNARSLLNLKDNEGRTMLHWASFYGHISLLKFFNSYYPTYQVLDHYKYNPLNMSMIRGYFKIFIKNSYHDSFNPNVQLETAKILLQKGLKFSYTPEGDFTPLHWACYHDNYELAVLII